MLSVYRSWKEENIKVLKKSTGLYTEFPDV